MAAVAYLLRPDGWAELVAACRDRAAPRRRARPPRRGASAGPSGSRRQVETATEELKDARRRHREQLAELKAENAELRHKLGDARARARAAEAAATQAARRGRGGARRGRGPASAQEAELRRLRARVGASSSATSPPSGAPGAPSATTATMRARLLLDTLLETAQGLRRELALPAVEGSPADRVEAHVAEHGSRTSVRARRRWPVGRPGAARAAARAAAGAPGRRRLQRHQDGLARAVRWSGSATGCSAGWPRWSRAAAPRSPWSSTPPTPTERPLVNRPRGVRVLFSPPGVIADDVIRELVAAEPQGRPLVVVSERPGGGPRRRAGGGAGASRPRR